jgi:peptide/nickel transport system substrate-binding protein
MDTSVTRRELIGHAARGGIVAAGASTLLSACGSGSSSSPTVATTNAKARRGGTLTVGLTGGSSSDTLDPNKLTTNPDFARTASLYDGMAWGQANGQPGLRVAEEMTPLNKDASRWAIRLRKDVRFHDGRVATADDLIYSTRRCLTPTPGVSASVLNGLRLKDLRKMDTRTVELTFDHPYTTLIAAIGGTSNIYLLPENFDPKHPIGTGPFKFESFTPGQRSVFTRWDEYWNQPEPYVDELVLVDYSDQTSQINALLSGQVDAVNQLSADVLATVTGGGKKALISPGGGYNPFTMRVDQAPFTDVNVRRAFQLIVDRPKMLEVVFAGHGVIGNDIWGIWDPEYDHALPQRVQDIEQAKHLLKAAGRENMTIELVTGDIAQGVIESAQVFAQQAAQAGVTVHLRQITPTEYFGPNYLKWTFAQDFWYSAPYLAQVPLSSLANSPYNETHFDNPRFNALFAQANATTDKTLQTEIVHEMQTIQYYQGGFIIPFFAPVIDGFSPKVQGMVPSKTGSSFNMWQFQQLSLSA